MTLAEFIQQLSDRVGIDNADEALKALVTNPALSQVTVPGNLVGAAGAKLMTEDEAKINPGIKRHFVATALTTVDNRINDVLEQYEFDDVTREAIKATQSTYERIPLLAKAIAEAKQQAISATGGEKKALLEKVQELQGLLNQERDARKADLERVNSQWQQQLTDKELQALLGSYDYALDLDKDVTISTARNLWEKKLNEKGGKYMYTAEGLKLVSKEAPDLPFTIDNKPVELRAFTEGVLAESKLLKVNKAPAAPIAPMPPAQQAIKPAAPAAKSQTSKALADFKAGSTLV